MSNMLKRGKGNNFLVDISSSPKMDSLEDVDSVGAIYTHRRVRGNVGNISKGRLLGLEIFLGDDSAHKIMVSYKETKNNSRLAMILFAKLFGYLAPEKCKGKTYKFSSNGFSTNDFLSGL